MAKNQEVLSKAQEQLDYATSRCGNLMEQLDKIRDQMKWHRGQDTFKSEENLVDAGVENKEQGEGVQSSEDTDELTESDLSHSVHSKDNSKKAGKRFDYQLYKKFSKNPRSTHNLSRSSSSYESLATSENLSIKSITLTDEELYKINKKNKQSNEMEDKDEEFGDLTMEAMDNEIYGEDEIIDDDEFKKELEAFFDKEAEEAEEDDDVENGEEKEDIQENYEEKDVSDEYQSVKYVKESTEKEKTRGMYHYRRESIGNDERQEEDEDELDMEQKYEIYHDLDEEKAEYTFEEGNLDQVFDIEENFYDQVERDSSISLDTDRSSLDENGILDKISDTELNEKQNYDDHEVTQEVIIKLNFDKEKAIQRENDKSSEETKSKKRATTQNEATGKFQKFEKNNSNVMPRQKESAKRTKLLEKTRPNTNDSKIMKTEAIKKDQTMQSKIAQEQSVLPSPITKASTDKITKGKKKTVQIKKNNENVNNNVQNARLVGKEINTSKQHPAQREEEKSNVENSLNTLKEKKDFKNIQENRKNGVVAGAKINNKKPVHEILKTSLTEKTKRKTSITSQSKQSGSTIVQNSKLQDNVTVNLDRQNANQKTIGQQKKQPVDTVKNEGSSGGVDKNNSNHLMQLNSTDVENNIYKEKLTKLRISNKIKKSPNSMKVNGASHEIISKSLLVNIQKTLRDKLNRSTDDQQINISNGQIETVVSKNLVKNKVNELNSIISKKNASKKETLNDKVNDPKQKPTIKEVAQPKQKLTKTVETINNNNKKPNLPKEEPSKVKNKTTTTFSRGNPNNSNPKELNMFKTFGQDENDVIVEDCRDEETLNLVATNWPPPGNFDLKANKVPHKVESAQVVHHNFGKMQDAMQARKGSESVQLPTKYTPFYKSGDKIWEERAPEIDNKTYIKTHTNHAEIQNAANTNNNNNTKNNYYSNKDNTTQTLAQSLGFNAIPFIVGQSTSRSYHIGLNIQQTMSLMKHTPSMPALKLGMEPSTGNISDKTSTFGSILSTSYYKMKTCPACATTKPFNDGGIDEYDDEELENVDDPWYVPQKDTWDKQNIANRKRARCTCLPKNVISFNQVLNQLFQKEGTAQIRPHSSSETQVVIKSEDESEKNDQEKKMIVRPNNAFYFTRLLRNIQRIQDQYMPTTKVSFNSMKYNTL
ncbi:uncharacterized protein isoform X1 [Rhodnius prolixus]|uniref:uncharacterized protein isoform X1 n=1 Tax=Rhodnius prolixus TaxID=13249 RepID=UPI003D18B1AA